MRKLPYVVWFAVALVLANECVLSDQLISGLSAPDSVSWSVDDARCLSRPERSFTCGDRGTYNINPRPDMRCELISGEEIPAHYPLPGLSPPGDWNRATATGEAAAATYGNLVESNARSDDGPSDPPAINAWVAVPDFDGWHGYAVENLVRQAGLGVSTTFHRLNDENGEVTDLSVLETLCGIRELADEKGAPAVIPLAWGRAMSSLDPRDRKCSTNKPSLACEIAQLIGSFVRDGTVVVAAGGNHRQLLFPAALSDVVVAGIQDVAYVQLTGAVRGIWESSPEGLDAVIPVHSTCVAGVWVPPGSSISTAVLAGLFASFPRYESALTDPANRLWTVEPCDLHVEENDESCFQLARSGHSLGDVHFDLEEILNPFDPGVETPCSVAAQGGEVVRVELGDVPPVAQPDVASLPDFIPEYEYIKTPEDRSCSPCAAVGIGGGSGWFAGSFLVDLSQSGSAAEETYLDKLYLRAGENFYLLLGENEARQRALFDTGTVGSLQIDNVSVSIERQLSLFSVVKTKESANCASSLEASSCYWSSTPIRLLN